MRATGGVFVWAIESALLALFGVGTISLMHMVGGTSPIALDVWAIFVILCSCVVNLVLQTFVAFSSKQPIIQDIPEEGDDPTPDFAMMYMHKAVAQGHCATVAMVLALHTITMQHSLTDLDWANAYYASAPGLVWVTGTITLAFITVLWFTSITGSWAATAVGDSNTLFFIIPTTSIICIMFPIVNEIGSNGLMVCSDPMSSTLAVLYANLALATSFAISLLDCVEFDPARILPKFMRTVGDRMPLFRIYGMLHGICVSITVVMYWISARKISTITVFVILSANVIVTLANSLAGIKLPTLWNNDSDNSVQDEDSETQSNSSGSAYDQDDLDTPDKQKPQTMQSMAFRNQFKPTLLGRNVDSRGPHKRRSRLTHIQTVKPHSLLPPTDASAGSHKHTNWLGIDFMKSLRPVVATQPAATAATSVAERRIALLRLSTHARVNEHEM
jgi:hypothetical protein